MAEREDEKKSVTFESNKKDIRILYGKFESAFQKIGIVKFLFIN